MSNNQILSCPGITEDRIPYIRSNIKQWLSTPLLSDLAKAFGATPDVGKDINYLSKWFLEFSDCWDFRSRQKQAYDSKVGEGARWLLSNDDLTEEQKELALSAALVLGLRDNAIPAYDNSDYIWVLGGAKLSCLLRSRLAAQTIKNAFKMPKAVVLLASMRPIGDAEREATNTYAPNAKTEFDLSVEAAHEEFSVSNDFEEEKHNDSSNDNNSWIIRKYGGSGYDVFIIAAPSSDPQNRRANSADTYEFFFNRFQAQEGASILLTTSQIYVPYQHMEAIRTIAVPHKIVFDTIGFPPEWGGELQGMNDPSNYLQEIRSTIQSIDRFLKMYV